mmetsp:Transcript_129790/g.224237  ORF Transcript_129790/g.224237 Transcript_129790/m.224237 type:complete len:441 (+) Transcript_129790:88-1410(+)
MKLGELRMFFHPNALPWWLAWFLMKEHMGTMVAEAMVSRPYAIESKELNRFSVHMHVSMFLNLISRFVMVLGLPAVVFASSHFPGLASFAVIVVAALAAYYKWMSVGVVVVRISQLKLTIPENDIQTCKQEADNWLLRVLGKNGMKDHNEVITLLKKWRLSGASRFTHSAIIDPAFYAHLDPASSQTCKVLLRDVRYWVLDNRGLLREEVQGLAYMQVKVKTFADVGPLVSDEIDRWRKLRTMVGQSGDRNIANKLNAIKLGFMYASRCDDGHMERLRMTCAMMGTTSTRRCAPEPKRQKLLSVDAVEQIFKKMLVEATAIPRAKGRMKRCQDDNVKMVPEAKAEAVAEEAEVSVDLMDDSELCIICLNARPEMIMKGCGHLVFCLPCCRRYVGLKKGLQSKKDTPTSMCESTGVSCPICRRFSCMVRKHEAPHLAFQCR